ncbi:SIMPL domain-containing protein [Anaerocolumna sp.]|uniref:SIMPL domain-containing protein n=1 Tax=Anaerocolumna sp. TaxID=2041569 RepID=UPI0028A691F5|nr:SIMPL domain-containing protein [Anaerocolumna sp.]
MSEYLYNNCCPNKQTMTLTGRGEISAIPDIAVIRLGVLTQGEDLIKAQTENADLSRAVIDSLKQLGITNIKTFQYTIDKIYEYVNGTRIDKGYSVRNILEINIQNIGQTGLVIDTAVDNGANVVDLVSFEVSKRDMYYQEALNLAIGNAIEKANSISHHLGISVDLIPIRIEENSAPPAPLLRNVAERAFATPIESGEQLIEAFVTAVFHY